MRILGLAALAAVLLAPSAQAELLRKESPHKVGATIDRLQSAAEARGLAVFGRVDHAAGAKKAGLDLRPTLLLVFGSPAVGTPLMQAEQTMGLSLPLRVLAWEDAAGKVWLGYDAPAGMAAERGLPKDHPVIVRLEAALKSLTDEAVKP
jgi:uncharacterized protein (DUF302 family)